ncbi:MAG: aldehyde ferredoxin oxidoreductase C-terminal domain-containing protein, partial [Dehalococcoidia bacterium]
GLPSFRGTQANRCRHVPSGANGDSSTQRGPASMAGTLGAPSYNPGRPVEQWVREAEKVGVPGEAMERIFTPTSFNPGRLTRYAEDWYSLSNCLGRCHRLYINRFYDANMVAELYSAVTGIKISPSHLLKGAERAWNLSKVLNIRAGFSREDDRAPQVWFTPLKGEGAEYRLMDYYKTTTLDEEDMERILDDYYEERGWDRKSGAPTAKKLRELGLEAL